MARMNAEINYENLPKNEYETIKPGKYEAFISECKETITKNEDNFMLVFTFKITNEGDFRGRIISYNILTTFNNLNKAEETKKACGQKLSELMNAIHLCQNIEDTDQFLNNVPVEIEIEVDTNGYNRIKRVRPLASTAPKTTPISRVAPTSVQNTTPSRPLPRRRITQEG